MLSIVIANKFVNQKLFKTLKSISIQKHLNKIEIIIINKDKKNNLNYLNKNFCNLNIKIINENDKNISDAFNKGIKNSSNKYLYFLGAGDTFYDRNVMKDLSSYLLDEKKLLIIGKVCVISKNDKRIINDNLCKFLHFQIISVTIAGDMR